MKDSKDGTQGKTLTTVDSAYEQETACSAVVPSCVCA